MENKQTAIPNRAAKHTNPENPFYIKKDSALHFK